MAYERKELQIAGGGFNLLPPGDKVPSTDYLLAQNWRVDRRGKLVSRAGHNPKFSIASAGLAHSAGIHGGINGDYYVGCNSAISSPSSAVYFNFSATAIATGFDGNRIGFAAMNGWMWIMNRAKQGRHNASNSFQTWNLAAPGNSVGAASAATPSASASATYSYTLQGNPAYIHYLTIAGVSYQFAENGYSAGQLPLVIASLASADPNCSVTYTGSGADVVITPIIPNTLISLTGSDGNSDINVATGSITSLPNGTYQYYVTFGTADDTLESNPGPASASVAVSGQAVALTSVPVSADARVGLRNIYATGGTLGEAYLVGCISDNATTTITIAISDLQATLSGIVMPTTNDAPPAASGIIGPFFSRLIAWSTAGNGNRLFYTDANLPQYWPGAADPAVGNWVDVGDEGENILWCTIHGNALVIYKDRSIWMMVGDPETGYLQQVRHGLGPTGQFALCPAGLVDYFVAPNGLCMFDMNTVTETGFQVAPLFNASLTHNGALTAPGSVLPGSAFNSASIESYAVSLGYAMGKLYIGYAETAASTSYCLLVYHEASQRWFYHRTAASNVSGFFGFVFDGVEMVGLSGTVGGAAVGVNIDDFRTYLTEDPGPTPIECVYQSHYEDAGTPDSQKVWLEAVIDFEFAGDSATVYAALDNGTVALTSLGTITGASRQTASFPLALSALGALVPLNPADATQTPALAKNISVAIKCEAAATAIVHNVYLYYYEEARLAQTASSLPSDLGVGKVKQCKELELDIDASGGAVAANLYSDLPGNALALRQPLTLATNPGRGVLKLPFGQTEGFLWKLTLAALAGPFRLYGARLLMRVVGVYVEGYEAAAGFVWDSMEMTFDSGITHIPRGYAIALAALPIKRFREITLEIETFDGDVTVTFITDLPGEAQGTRFTSSVNTAHAGRRFVRIPLPGGTNPPIEGRLARLKLSASSKFILYNAAVEVLAVGVYVEAYEAAAGAVFDSRELDFGTPAVKEARELELDIETTGNITAQLLADGVSMFSSPTVATTGRQKVMLPLTVNVATGQFVEGRLLRLILSGTNAFRLYGARLRFRPFGQYLLASENQAGALWDSTELDLGTQQVKQLREIELDIWAYGTFTLTVYTDLPGNAMTARITRAVAATNGRTKVQVPLPQGGVPDNYLFGRLVRVTITSADKVKLFGARIDARAIGVYVESYEASGGAVWDSTPNDLGTPNDKTFDQVRIETDSDGAAAVAVYTDLPGESFAVRGAFALTAGPTSRHFATVPLPAGIEGRSVRLIVSSTSGFRIYKAQVRAAQVGRYLAATGASGAPDALTTLEFDFQSERLKLYKKLELDIRADQTVTFAAYTEQGGAIAQVFTQQVTSGGRKTVRILLPPGIRGRLLRVSVTGGPARIYHLRVWTRAVNEPGAKWAWEDYPLEESDVLPKWADLPVDPTAPAFAWADLPVDPTPPEWPWAPFPVNPTEAQWFWAKVLAVEDTPDVWEWVTLPVNVQ